MLTKLKIIG